MFYNVEINQVQDNPLGLSEAEAMRDIAVAAGISGEEVLLEDKVCLYIHYLIA